LVEGAQRLGMVVDLAHAGRKTALDSLEVAKRPVVISHANVANVYKHPRNVDGEVVKRLADNGDVPGLTFIPRTIPDSSDPRDIARHAKYVKERFGVEVLAVGTDYPGISATPRGLESVDRIELYYWLLGG
jgi:membrane dipeptidase